MPGQPEAFAEQVLKMLMRHHTGLEISLSGPSELTVNGRRLDLDNPHRLVSTDPNRGVEIVERYLDHLFDEEIIAVGAMPWEVARSKIMPRIQPDSIFDHLSCEQVAHIEYVNGTVIVFVIDMPHMTVSVTTEQMLRWGVDVERLERVARKNLARYTPDLEFRRLESEEGGRAIVLSIQDGYDASRLLLSDIFMMLAPEFGGDFYVATPSRDMFLAMSQDPGPFIDRVQSRVDMDFERLPYPITNRLFYVTRDGVAGTLAA